MLIELIKREWIFTRAQFHFKRFMKHNKKLDKHRKKVAIHSEMFHKFNIKYKERTKH